MKYGYYTPDDLAAALGVSPQCVREKLRRRFPDHKEMWWRFTQIEFERIRNDLAPVVKPRSRAVGEG